MPASQTAAAKSNGSARVLSGFLLSGFLMALLGAILPAWGFHRDPPHFVEVGNYFLCLALGIAAATRLSLWIIRVRSLKWVLVFACLLSCAALLFLAAVSPPAGWAWRALGLAVLGMGAGLLNVSLFHALSPGYRTDPAGSVNQGGIWYGMGCLAATLLVAGTFYAYTVPVILTIVAAAPLGFAAIYSRSSFAVADEGDHPTLQQTLRDFISPSALLYAGLLFFQFGNEWSVAGWLPIFLIRRIGMSPSGALRVLALYWVCLMLGRLVAAIALLPRIKHGRLLLGSGLAAMFGCFMLFLTNNWFGASMAVLVLGLGFASLYPLLAEAIGKRFPYYHPGFFNGIFSIALLGGLLAPASLGYAAAAAGSVGVVMGIPLVGTIIVGALLLLVWLEVKISGR